MIVVDTHVLAYRLVRGDKTDLAIQAQELDPDWVVPCLTRHEFLSVLATLGRRGVLTARQCAELWTVAEPVILAMERPVDMAGALALALQKVPTAYGAQYASLALSLGVRCLTEDRDLLRACPEVATSLRDFCARARA